MTPFPAAAFRRILADRDAGRYWHWLTIYPQLWRVVQEIAPKRIVEIGTRAGYSAWTMLRACPEATVEAFDLDCDEHGGYNGAHEHARRILPPDRFRLTIVDSHTLDRLPACDVALVDGDHTSEGAYLDLCLCERSGVPIALLDDVTLLPEVKAAGDRFCAERGLVPTFIPSRTGLYRIDLPRPPDEQPEAEQGQHDADRSDGPFVPHRTSADALGATSNGNAGGSPVA